MTTNFNNEKHQSSHLDDHFATIKFPARFNNAPQLQSPTECSRNNYLLERTYCETIQKNKPQSNSVIGGISLLFVSGLHIGWGIWRLEIREPWVTFANLDIIIFIIMSWYVFATVGGIVGATLVTNLRKKWIYYTGGILLATSSILFIVWYDSHVSIIIGRCIAGFAHGIIYNATITHAAENVVKEIRGMLLSTVHCLMFSGIFVAATLIASVTYGYSGAFNSDRILGMFGLLFSMLGIFCTVFLTYESIPFLLRHEKDSDAIVSMLKLRNESVMTTKLANDLDEIRLMVSQDKQDDNNIFTDGNCSPMVKMIVLRMLSNLTNNILLNVIMMNLTSIIIDKRYFQLAAVILTGTRVLSSCIPIISTDFFLRKVHLLGSGIISGLLVLILAIIMVSVNQFRVTTYWIPAAICISFQLFVSIGIDPMTHLLLSEAFSTSKKAWSIAFVTAAEYLSQILLIGLFFIDGVSVIAMNVILFVTAGLMLILGVIFEINLPETFKTTMKEARDLFRN